MGTERRAGSYNKGPQATARGTGALGRPCRPSASRLYKSNSVAEGKRTYLSFSPVWTIFCVSCCLMRSCRNLSLLCPRNVRREFDQHRDHREASSPV